MLFQHSYTQQGPILERHRYSEKINTYRNNGTNLHIPRISTGTSEERNRNEGRDRSLAVKARRPERQRLAILIAVRRLRQGARNGNERIRRGHGRRHEGYDRTRQ